ncbi:mitosis inhibitor protein kinase swe1 [Coemansia asiatica]|uniref:Mitosis inhibitor protein kinase swe1 n=1 Tax=Coemansia asiatica TaxID=1052880 RepID=A0A9W7XJS4_9FUNG|nr:mitosis inhibitor protein kinase swe1 [Coemansia asiatica]
MTETPHRPATRAMRKNMIQNESFVQAPPAPAHPLTRSRRRATPALRPCSSFPSLPAEESPSCHKPLHAKKPSNSRIVGSRRQSTGDSPQPKKQIQQQKQQALKIQQQQKEKQQQQQGDMGNYGVESPTTLRRQSLHSRIVGERQASLLSCLTPTPNRIMESPINSNLHSLSPSPSPSPYMNSRRTYRRLTFSPADIAAAQAAAGSSVAGSGGVSAPASAGPNPPSLFTPPATKLVRPDPSVFASTGLQSRKQLVRSRRNTSFVTPETPCKRAGGAESSETAAAATSIGEMVDGDNETSSALVTPNANGMQSVVKTHVDFDPFKLGKHRNTSTDSLRRTRKKPHLGPVIDDSSDLQSLFDTPCRPRQNTLVDEDFMQQPPPDFRIPGIGDDLCAPSAAMPEASAASKSTSLLVSMPVRPLPPSFAPQHQLLMQSLVADKMVDPDSAPWDQSVAANNRWSWATGSDACSESSAATLASNSNSFATASSASIGGKGKNVMRRSPLQSHGKSTSADDGLVFGVADKTKQLKKSGIGFARSRLSELFRFGNRSCSNLVSDDMELDVATEDDDDDDDDDDKGDDDDGDVSDKGEIGDYADASDDGDDVFGDGSGSGSGAGRRMGQLTMQSPRIMAVERPQMPQIVQGFATNYAHFLGRDYFLQADKSLPFLAPSGDFHVDGLGYLDFFAHQFEIISRAGEGHFSSVFSVRSLVDGQMYAVKRTRHPFTGRQERARRLREVDILWSVPQCDGIVRLVNAWEQFGHLFMQFELCEQGSLEGFLDRRAQADERLPEARAWAILAHAAYAVSRLHDSNIAHLDIKPANFLLGPQFGTPGGEQHEGWLKLADFGHAVRLPHEPLAWVEEGDREYMAPEVLRGIYTKAADVFSLGLMMLEITADIVLPDNGVEWHKLRENCFDDQVFDDLPYSADLLETIKLMLHPDPSQRPTLHMILSLSQCTLYTSAPVGSPRSVVSEDCGDDFMHLRPRLHGSYNFNHPLLMRASTADAEPYPHHHHHHQHRLCTTDLSVLRHNQQDQQHPPRPFGQAQSQHHLSVHPMVTRSAAAAAVASGNGGGLFSKASASSTSISSAPPSLSSTSASSAAAAESRPRASGRRGLSRRTASAPGPAPPSFSSTTNATRA